MATTERPKSRLPDGRVNPEYTAWRKANILGKPGTSPEPVEESPGSELVQPARFFSDPPDGPVSITGLGEWINDAPETPAGPITDAALSKVLDQVFQSAAEPEQTNIDDPREPEVAPALETPLPAELDSEAGSSPAPADGDLLTITVDRAARNKSFVYGALNGELIPVRIKKGMAQKLIGKPIPVRVSFEAGHTLYAHAP